MAVDYVKITTSSSTNYRATKAMRLVVLIREVQELMKQVKAYVDHSSATPDFTGLEGANGLGVAAGQGATFAALLNAARTRINHTDVDLLIDQVGE